MKQKNVLLSAAILSLGLILGSSIESRAFAQDIQSCLDTEDNGHFDCEVCSDEMQDRAIKCQEGDQVECQLCELVVMALCYESEPQVCAPALLPEGFCDGTELEIKGRAAMWCSTVPLESRSSK